MESDDRHTVTAKVVARSQKRNRRFVTTDYVLDETATLFKARRKAQLLAQLYERLDHSQVYRVEWTDSERFHEVRTFFLKHADKDWSCTDCLSFTVMSRLRHRDALTKDGHFCRQGSCPCYNYAMLGYGPIWLMPPLGLEPSANPSQKLNNSQQGGAKSGALADESAPGDPELAELVAAWATLPEPIRAGIVAMVRSIGTPGAKPAG